MDPKAKAPPPVERPRLAIWLHERGLVYGDITSICGVGREQIRRYCLPFGDPMHVTPPRGVIESVHAYTNGEIGPADWYPSRLSQSADVALAGAVQ